MFGGYGAGPFIGSLSREKRLKEKVLFVFAWLFFGQGRRGDDVSGRSAATEYYSSWGSFA